MGYVVLYESSKLRVDAEMYTYVESLARPTVKVLQPSLTRWATFKKSMRPAGFWSLDLMTLHLIKCTPRLLKKIHICIVTECDVQAVSIGAGLATPALRRSGGPHDQIVKINDEWM